MKRIIFCLMFLCTYAQAESCYKDGMILYKLTQCANSKDALAQVMLGVAYYKGEGVAQDDKKATSWFLKAAEQGNADGQFNLGVMYYKGKSVPQNSVLAYMWWTLGAAQKHDKSIHNREILKEKLTPEQISKALQMANDWLAKHPQK